MKKGGGGEPPSNTYEAKYPDGITKKINPLLKNRHFRLLSSDFIFFIFFPSTFNADFEHFFPGRGNSS